MADRTAMVQRLLPAPPEVVYDQWLDPEALVDWMCPHPARCLAVDVEPWEGGTLRIDIEDAGVQFVVAGRYLELDRPRRIRFTWSCSTWPDPAWLSVVTVTFEPRSAETTHMVIEHAMLPPDLVDQHESGWTAIAGQLASQVSRT